MCDLLVLIQPTNINYSIYKITYIKEHDCTKYAVQFDDTSTVVPVLNHQAIKAYRGYVDKSQHILDISIRQYPLRKRLGRPYNLSEWLVKRSVFSKTRKWMLNMQPAVSPLAVHSVGKLRGSVAIPPHQRKLSTLCKE